MSQTPPPPNTSTVTSVQPAPIVAAPPQPLTPSFQMTPSTPSPLPMFDVSRPPPSIPAMAINKNVSQKRPALSDDSVSICKVRKTEDRTEDVHCDLCRQRGIRIQFYKHKMEKIRAEDEYHSLVYKKSVMEYQKLKDILRTLIDGDLFKLVEESLGDVPQSSVGDRLSGIIPSVLSGMFSSGSKQNDDQFLLQFMEYMFSKTRTFGSSSVRVEESLRTLPTPSRRSRQSPDIIQTLTDILGSSSQRSVEVSADSDHSSGTTGEASFCRYNRPSLDKLRPPLAPTPATPPVVPPPSSYPPAVLQPPTPPLPRHPNRMPFNPQHP